MRYLFGLLCVCALGVVPLVGCGEAEGPPPECRTDADCDDQNECTVDFCDAEGSCYRQSSELNGNPCDLNGAPGVCVGGVCGECQGDEDCDDGEECTTDTCTGGMCEYTTVADGTACDESNECTVGMCASGACDSTPVADGTTCGDGAGTCCSGTCIPEILPVLDGANGIQASVFQASCTSSACHGSNGASQAGLELSSASVSEANLINVDSTQVDKLRVAPGDPDASYLLDKLLGRNLAPGTVQQPPLGGPLCDPKIQAVEEWIATGANGGVGCVYGAQEQDAITCINGEAPTTDAGTVYFNAENCADAANTVYDLTLANADGVTEVFLWAGIENAGCEQAANRSVVREVCGEVARNPLTVGDNATVFDLTLQGLVDTGIVDCTALEGQHYEIYSFRNEAPGSRDVPTESYGVAQFKVGVTLPE